MKLVTIVADTAAEALAEVHRQLGPEAIVVNVRKTSAPGLSRIWKKPQIEIQAAVAAKQPSPAPKPQPQAQAQAPSRTPSIPKQQPAKKGIAQNPYQKYSQLNEQPTQPAEEKNNVQQILEQYKNRKGAINDSSARKPSALEEAIAREAQSLLDSKGNRAVPKRRETDEISLTRMLENLGIQPLYAQWLSDQVRADGRGENLGDQFKLVQGYLQEYWNQLSARVKNGPGTTRVLIGAPGVGKTTCMCKWLTQEVLLNGQKARVWRLDTHTANTAEFLSIHGEILGIPVERIWDASLAGDPAETHFVDVPGVSISDLQAIQALEDQIKSTFQSPQIYLVLNAAYELSHLLDQIRVFSSFPIAGLILTHLDEDGKWSKFWNLLLGSKLPILFLSGGQNIPGNFSPASPQNLFEVSLEEEPTPSEVAPRHNPPRRSKVKIGDLE